MGVFTIYNDSDTDSTVISNLFIDEYMKDANDVQIKVYLYLVRMMSAGRAASFSDITELFGISEKETLRAMKYWEKKGLLSLQKSSSRGSIVSIHLCELKQPVRAQEEETMSSEADSAAIAGNNSASGTSMSSDPSAAGVVVPITAGSASPAGSASSAVASQQLTAFGKDTEKAQVIFIVEQYIGKPLSVSELKTLYYISEQLHFSTELIDYLVQYCVGRGKKDFRYIEKVAINWAESGISTVREAEKASSPQRASARGRKSAPAAAFNAFEEKQYDFDAIEKALLQG